MHSKKIVIKDGPVEKGKKLLLMIHGRGGSAEDILSLSDHLNVSDYVKLAPQATNNTWYPYSFLEEPSRNEPWLSSAIQMIETIVNEILEEGVPLENIYFAGFSQGACLMTEFLARNAKRYGGAVAFTGGLIGDEVNRKNYSGDFKGTPFFIGSSDPDSHVPVARIDETVKLLEEMNANVLKKIYPDMGHTIIKDEIDLANRHIFK